MSPPRKKKIECVGGRVRECKKEMEINMPSSLNVLGVKMGGEIVRMLSNKYGFDRDEALKHLNLKENIVKSVEKDVTKKKSSIPLPFCGKVCEDNCEAIRLNHNLYTQCTNDKMTTINGHSVCSTCEKQIEKNSNNMPTYGYISERVEKGKEFRDPKGKAPVNYGNLMEKLNISRNEAEREAANQGVTIPEDQFEVKVVKRGRPKKDTTAVDTSGSEEEAPKSEKKRGRPKKEKVVVTSIGNSMIKELVKEANTVVGEAVEPALMMHSEPAVVGIPVIEAEEPSANDDGDEQEVEKFSFKGKEYLKSTSDNTLYDVDSWEEIGVWNPETNTIDAVESDED